MKKLLLIFFLLHLNNAWCDDHKDSVAIQSQPHKRPVNVYIISKDKYFDLTNRIITWQARLAAFFHHKLKIVMAYSTADAEKKIHTLIKEHDYTIDNLWLDSHGKYRKGYSSLMIGTDEYNYNNIGDSDYTRMLKKIASYCNPHTCVGIGSCYAASDFDFPVSHNGKKENMHGDSLLKGLGKIFEGNMVYASKSWVMAKLWIFGSRNALAGYPLDKQYRDTIFLPVWKSMGIWDRYSTLTQVIQKINTVSLSVCGDILVNENTYMDQDKAKRKLARNLKRLHPGLYQL
jgi:hypothetical protein